MTLEPLLEACAPHLSQPLVSAESHRDMQSLGSVLSRELIHRCGIEVRLGAGLLPADLSVCLRRDGAAHRAASLASRSDSAAAWSRLAVFCETWQDPASFLYDRLHEIWLEFDLESPRADPQLREPVVSLSGLRWREKPGTERFCAEVAAMFDEAAALYPQANQPAIDVSLIDRCVRQLPEWAVVVHIVALGARATRSVRLIVSVRWQEVAAYLVTIGWPGPVDRAERFAMRYGPRVQSLSLCLDLGTDLAPQLGIELFPHAPDRKGKRIGGLLDLMVADGLCTVVKREQFVGWRGSSPLGDGRFVGRTSSHLKLGLRDGCEEAKAYVVLAEVRRSSISPFLPLRALHVGGLRA